MKFTAASSRTEAPFLDILITVSNDFPQTDLHTKPATAHNYFHCQSACHSKDYIPSSQFLRMRRLCCKDEDYRICCSGTSQHLQEMSYPTYIVRSALQRVKQIRCTHTHVVQAQTLRAPCSFYYYPQSLQQFKQWFIKLLPNQHFSNRMQRAVP